MMRRFWVPVAVGGSAVVLTVAIGELGIEKALAAAATLALVAVAVMSLRRFLWLSLVFKPIIDIFYNSRIGPISVQRAVGVLGPVVAMLVVLGSGADVLVYPMVMPIAAFTLVNVVGVLFSVDPVKGTELFFRVVGPIAFYFAASQILPDNQAVKKFVRMLLIVLMVPYGYALLQLVGIVPRPLVAVTAGLTTIRLMGPYTGPWDLARYLVVSIPLCLLEIEQTKGRERAWWWVYLTANLLIAAFTNLRYAQLAAFLELVAWFFLTGQGAKLAVAVSGAAVLLVTNLDFLSRLYADALPQNGTYYSTALSGRVGVWENYTASFKGVPIVYRLFGTGLDLSRIIGGTSIQQDPHNDVLRVLVTNGWFGLVVYVWLLIAMAWFLVVCVRRLRTAGDVYRLELSYVTVCIYLGYVAGSLTARPSQYPSLAWFMWLFFGLLAATLMNPSREAEHG